MFYMPWGQKVNPDFRKKVIQICRDFNWTNDHATYLMACMAFESGESFSPSVRNGAGSGAVGLIQFMPATAVELGTTTQQLAKMTAECQLDYVKKYFRPYYKRITTLSDMYMAILLPKFVGAPESSVLFSSGVAYRQNAVLDTNKDGLVTKLEATRLVTEKWIKGMQYSTPEQDVIR